MGTPQVPFDPTGSPFPKNPPQNGERDDETKRDDENIPDDSHGELS